MVMVGHGPQTCSNQLVQPSKAGLTSIAPEGPQQKCAELCDLQLLVAAYLHALYARQMSHERRCRAAANTRMRFSAALCTHC